MSRSLYARLHRTFGNPIDPFTRREMLAATLAASAGLLLSKTPIFAADNAKRNQRRVVVVGAGFAGLACAHELKAAGYDVSVIEARNRVGGRVLSFSDFVPGRNVEGGGELIGSNHPTWVNYADKFGLSFLDVTEDDSLAFPIMLGGQKLDKDAAEALWEEMESAVSTFDEDAAKVDADEPWKSPDAAAFDKRTVGDWIKNQTVSDLCKKGLHVQITADNGVTAEKQSYLALLTAIKGGGMEGYWTESEVYRCAGGNQQLATKLLEAIGADRVTLKLPVKKIKVSGDKVVVTCADNRTIEADDVILAVPPSVWSKIDIEPALPRTLTPQMGVSLKYLSHLKNRFWKEHGLAPDCLTDGDISMTWDATDGQDGDSPAGMVAFSGGPAAERCRSRQGTDADAAYKKQHEEIYPGYAQALVGTRFMDWPGDPWTNAGYSFPAPGEVTAMGPILHKGLGRLHFAGEHTCYKFAGYMEGALNGGASLAKRIATRDGVISAGG